MSQIIPWQKQSEEVAFKKYSRIILKRDFILPDGSVSDFYIKQEGPAVAIFAITPDSQVVLTRQYRPGPEKILIELPGGYIDANETPEQAALRELKEETGYEGDAEFVTGTLDCAYSTMVRSAVVVRDAKKITEPIQSSTEQTEVVLIPVDEFRKLLLSGQMTDIEIGYLCLDKLGLL